MEMKTQLDIAEYDFFHHVHRLESFYDFMSGSFYDIKKIKIINESVDSGINYYIYENSKMHHVLEHTTKLMDLLVIKEIMTNDKLPNEFKNLNIEGKLNGNNAIINVYLTKRKINFSPAEIDIKKIKKYENFYFFIYSFFLCLFI